MQRIFCMRIFSVDDADAQGLMHSRKDSSSHSNSPLAGTCSPVFHGALIHAVQEQKHTLRQPLLSADAFLFAPLASSPSFLTSAFPFFLPFDHLLAYSLTHPPTL